TEIKSIKLNKISLKEGWVEITEKHEAILQGIHISPYEKGNIYNHEPKRPRKLLLKKKEINKIANQVQAKGMSVIPIKVYLTRQFVKVEIALAKGKKLYDKRQTDKKKEDQRSIERSIKKHNYNE
ncbi:MAG: SsrA-binding protein, partial [Zetaproteobacteria bacterium]|nr:SsrA-binding protein [Pseudobdellovibrionaceae bacterium]